ncbi:MAG: flavodoxin family protein [Candidatus Shapirobacteria bacterium]
MKILSICGSPRRGNSETILLELQKLFKERGIENEVVLLREKKIERCHGCVENCNPAGVCCQHDDVEEILDKMVASDGIIYISPNYFQMPTGLLKDFMDRSSVAFASGRAKNLENKKSAVICVGTDEIKEIDVCVDNIANLYCQYFGKVVVKKSFRTHSELKGNYNDIFENDLNPDIRASLGSIVEALLK